LYFECKKILFAYVQRNHTVMPISLSKMFSSLSGVDLQLDANKHSLHTFSETIMQCRFGV